MTDQAPALIIFLETTLAAARAGTLRTFVASATILPPGSNELDAPSHAHLDPGDLSPDDLGYALNCTTVGMSNAFEALGDEFARMLKSREDTAKIVLPPERKIVL